MGTAQITGQTFITTAAPIREVFFGFEKLLNIYIKRLTRVTHPGCTLVVWLALDEHKNQPNFHKRKIY
jgi:hypothetical protein